MEACDIYEVAGQDGKLGFKNLKKGLGGPGRRIEIRKDDPFDRNVQSLFKVRCWFFFLARSDAGPFLFCRRKSVHGMRAELTIS